MPQFEWDEKKNQANRAKHGLGFEDAAGIFDGPVVTAPDDREDYGEQRLISYGAIAPKVVIAVVYTRRHGRIRLISARKASLKERQAYYAYREQQAPEH